MREGREGEGLGKVGGECEQKKMKGDREENRSEWGREARGWGECSEFRGKVRHHLNNKTAQIPMHFLK